MKTRSNQLLLSSSLALACAMLVSGCAFGTRQAKVTYPPPQRASTNKLVADTAAPGSKGEIVLLPFTDDRADKNLLGHVRNGYGMKTAKVVSVQDDLTDVLNEAVRTELVRAGYSVLQADDNSLKSAPALSGSLVQLYCDAYMTYEGTASIYVRMTRGGNEVFRKTYKGEGSAGLNWAMTGASYGNSLSLAMQDALESLKRDLPGVLKP